MPKTLERRWIDAVRRRIWDARDGGRFDVEVARGAVSLLSSLDVEDLSPPTVHVGMFTGYIALTWVSERRKLEIIFRKGVDAEYTFKTKGAGADSYESRGSLGLQDADRLKELTSVWSVERGNVDPGMDRSRTAGIR